MQSNLYVVRASHMLPFFNTLKEFATPVEPLLNQVGLSLSQFNSPDNLIPEAPLWAFVDLAAKKLNKPHFGFLVTEHTCLDQYGAFGVHLCQATNLSQALHSFIHDLQTHTNYLNYWLEEDEEFVWLCRKGTPGIEVGKWPVEQHVLSFMIELVRIYAGKGWQPSSVRFHSEDSSGIEHVQCLTRSKLLNAQLFGQKFGAIAIEKTLLSNTSTITNNESVNNESANNELTTKKSAVLADVIPVDLKNTLITLINQHYFGEQLTVEKVADKLQINIRTLQRRLVEQGIQLRTLIDEQKFLYAKKLLLNSKNSQAEIAQELGYNDTGNFTRAFKRWSSMTPSAFKKLKS